MAQELGALALLLGLAGTSVGLQSQKLDLLHSKTELSYLVTGGASGVAYLGPTDNMGPLLLLNYQGSAASCGRLFKDIQACVPF